MVGRPREHENLVNISITVEKEIADMIMERFPNKRSEICRNALIEALNDPMLKKKYDKLARVPEEIIADIVGRLEKTPGSVRGCVNIIRREAGVKVTEEELLEWFGRYEKETERTNRELSGDTGQNEVALNIRE